MPSRELSFSALRAANRARIPQFKNKLGGLAHAKPDGSDWAPSQWVQALFGELGEFARVRQQYEAGVLDYEAYCREARKELADVQCYLDLLAMRALDQTTGPTGTPDFSQVLMDLLAHLGEYANWRKKHERGDIDEHKLEQVAAPHLAAAAERLTELRALQHPGRAAETKAHPMGVDLGQATVAKFNEVSERVQASVFLGDGQVRGA